MEKSNLCRVTFQLFWDARDGMMEVIPGPKRSDKANKVIQGQVVQGQIMKHTHKNDKGNKLKKLVKNFPIYKIILFKIARNHKTRKKMSFLSFQKFKKCPIFGGDKLKSRFNDASLITMKEADLKGERKDQWAIIEAQRVF